MDLESISNSKKEAGFSAVGPLSPARVRLLSIACIALALLGIVGVAAMFGAVILYGDLSYVTYAVYTAAATAGPGAIGGYLYSSGTA